MSERCTAREHALSSRERNESLMRFYLTIRRDHRRLYVYVRGTGCPDLHVLQECHYIAGDIMNLLTVPRATVATFRFSRR